MFGKVHITKATLAQFFTHFILTKAATRIEILTSGCIENGLIFDILKVVFEVLCPIRIEQPDDIDIEQFSNIAE